MDTKTDAERERVLASLQATESERDLAVQAHAWLIDRGWIVQLNTPDQCTGNTRPSSDGTRTYDLGWVPFFSARYGHQPVYRGVGEARWP